MKNKSNDTYRVTTKRKRVFIKETFIWAFELTGNTSNRGKRLDSWKMN